MDKGSAVMVSEHPVPVSVGNLIVDPHKWSPVRPLHQGPGLPVQTEPSVFVFAFGGGLRPVHDRKRLQPQPRR